MDKYNDKPDLRPHYVLVFSGKDEPGFIANITNLLPADFSITRSHCRVLADRAFFFITVKADHDAYEKFRDERPHHEGVHSYQIDCAPLAVIPHSYRTHDKAATDDDNSDGSYDNSGVIIVSITIEDTNRLINRIATIAARRNLSIVELDGVVNNGVNGKGYIEANYDMRFVFFGVRGQADPRNFKVDIDNLVTVEMAESVARISYHDVGADQIWGHFKPLV